MQLDSIDLKLLNMLQKDATLTNKALSIQLNRSVAAIQERRKKLKENGYIKRIVAIVDGKKIDRSLVAFAHVLLKSHSAEKLNAFENGVAQFNEVTECMQITGTCDFILRVAIKDIDAYNIFLRHKLATLPNIGTVQSFFVLRETKNDTARPV